MKTSELAWKRRLGLGFKLDNSSLVYQMKDKGLISSFSFSLTALANGSKYLNIGGIPEEAIRDKHVSQCKVNQESIEWSCTLQSIVVNETTYANKYKAYFTVEFIYIYSPVEFYNLLFGLLLKEGFDQSKCRHLRGEYFDNKLECVKEYVDNLTVIAFVIDDYTYPLNTSEVFECVYKSCQYLLMPNYHSDDWVIGSAFLNLFSASLFDYEQSAVVFYSDEIIYNATKGDIDHMGDVIRCMCCCLCLIVLLIGITFELTTKRLKYTLRPFI